nr:phosphatase PAP2 family protein [Streptomyces sp. ODS05-4]
MRETPRPQGTAGDTGAEPPQPRTGRALAHTAGASRSGSPLRSDSRPPHTPRGTRHTDEAGPPGTTPPVPGRPALLVLLLLPALLFAAATWQVLARGPVVRLDERVSGALVGAVPAPLAELGADLGDMPVAVPVLVAAVVWALRRGARAAAGWAALAMVLVPVLVVPLKLLVDRAGPLTDATGYYPSGHTATAMAAYGGAALLVRERWRWAAPVAVFLTAATGAGLVLRGYHWPLDVAGSLCLGVLLLAPLWWVSSSGRRRSSGRTPRRRTGPS